MVRVGTLGAVLLIFISASATAAEMSRARQDELVHRLRHDCGSCHGLTLKGGLGPPLLPQQMRRRSERHLIDVILDGIPGTPMPPWGFELTDNEARWLVRQLKRGLDDGL